MIFNKRFYFFLSIDIILFLAWIYSRDPLILGLWTSILVIFSFSCLSNLNSLNGIEITRTSRIKRQQVGGVFEERFEIKNNSRLRKLWVEITDTSLLGNAISSRVIANLKPNQIRIYSSSILLLKRGVYSLGPTILNSGDPLGLFKSLIKIPSKKSIVVYPQLINIQKFSIYPSSREGGGHLQIQTAQTTPQASGIREYQPGDPLNRVHWPYTMKHGKLMVKEFDEETQSNAWILLDAQKNMHHREKVINYSYNNRFASIRRRAGRFQLPRDSFEYAVSIAATLANYYIKQNIAVGLTSVGREFVNVQPDKGNRQLSKILEKLAVINDDGDLPITAIFEKQKSNIPKGSSVIMITAVDFREIESPMHVAKLKRIKLLPIRINTNSFIHDDRILSKMYAAPGNNKYLEINYGDDIEKKITNFRYI
jgi:uncharacterized protein (DUF58 family)